MNENNKILDWIYNISDSSAGKSQLVFEATREELKQLASEFQIKEIRSLKVKYDIESWLKTGFSVKGLLHAVVVQNCIISLVPIETIIEEEFCINFLPESEGNLYESDITSEGVIEIDYLKSDPPDLFSGTEIELGKVAEEQLALNLPAFPRAKGVKFSKEIDDQHDSSSTAKSQDTPFAVLAKLKSTQIAKK